MREIIFSARVLNWVLKLGFSVFPDFKCDFVKYFSVVSKNKGTFISKSLFTPV
jgi:hypothetical protein